MTTCSHSTHTVTGSGTRYGMIEHADGNFHWVPCQAPARTPLPIQTLSGDFVDLADQSVGDIVREFAVTRGDLSEQYARDQMTVILERKMSFVHNAADAYTERAEQFDDALQQTEMLEREVGVLRAELQGIIRSTFSANEEKTLNHVVTRLDGILNMHATRVANLPQS